MLEFELIEALYELKDQFGSKIALNTNGTKSDIIKRLIELKLVDIFYVDLKFPIVDYNFNIDTTAAWSHPNGDQFGRRCK